MYFTDDGIVISDKDINIKALFPIAITELGIDIVCACLLL